MRIRERYERPDENGSTRRERNKSADTFTPPLIIPEQGKHLWNIFYSVSDRIKRISEGYCLPIPPSEMQAWINLTGDVVYPVEYDILCAMDDAYRKIVNEELNLRRERENERMEKAAQQRRR